MKSPAMAGLFECPDFVCPSLSHGAKKMHTEMETHKNNEPRKNGHK